MAFARRSESHMPSGRSLHANISFPYPPLMVGKRCSRSRRTQGCIRCRKSTASAQGGKVEVQNRRARPKDDSAPPAAGSTLGFVPAGWLLSLSTKLSPE